MWDEEISPLGVNILIRDSARLVLPTYLSSSLPSEHKVNTRCRHSALFFALAAASPQVRSRLFSSFSMVFRQVVFGLPLDLFRLVPDQNIHHLWWDFLIPCKHGSILMMDSTILTPPWCHNQNPIVTYLCHVHISYYKIDSILL